MKAVVIAALAMSCAAPAMAQKAVEAPGIADPSPTAKPGTKPANDFDMAKLTAMFDKIFPPQPDPPAARLTLARVTAGGVLPDGTYAAIFEEMMAGLVDRMLALNPSEIVPKDAKGKPVPSSSLRQEMVKQDPHFEERMQIMRRVVSEELRKMSALLEPRLRDGLARSIARRFDEKQLTDINAFLGTDSGRAFAGQSMRMWVDPDVMRSMMQSLPQMMTAMPGAMARLEAETKHLPKPKPRKPPAKKS